jgi:hypothetical protein
MALIESSEGGRDPRINDYVMREDISTAASSNGGEHRGAVDIPIGVKVNAIAIEFATAVSGGSVDALDFGICNDMGVFFQGGTTRVLTAGTRYFSVFEYGNVNLLASRNMATPGVSFVGDGDPDYGPGHVGGTSGRVRTITRPTASENNSRVVLYTRQEDGFTAATTTAGNVRVTVYGTRYSF